MAQVTAHICGRRGEIPGAYTYATLTLSTGELYLIALGGTTTHPAVDCTATMPISGRNLQQCRNINGLWTTVSLDGVGRSKQFTLRVEGRFLLSQPVEVHGEIAGQYTIRVRGPAEAAQSDVESFEDEQVMGRR